MTVMYKEHSRYTKPSNALLSSFKIRKNNESKIEEVNDYLVEWGSLNSIKQ
jgi:hypothetical protein